MIPADALADRRQRARRSLDGLAVGDAFGERFFGDPARVRGRIARRDLPPAPWAFTDDSIMALAIVEILERHGEIRPDALAARFGEKYLRDPARGYGGTAHTLLGQLGRGADWRIVSPAVYDGQGSKGNGGAMRAGPLGAYFADDPALAARQARRSAEVTHAHPDGQAGAIAVAVAAAFATRGLDDPAAFFTNVLSLTPVGDTREGIARAAQLPLTRDVEDAAAILGNGSHVVARDTVPFALWCVARHAPDFEAALWTTVAGLGDRDTTCAIVGGIVALCPETRVPEAWQQAREPWNDFAD